MPKNKELLFFDTDNLACFLWIDNRAILPLLYPGRIRIPEQVEQEIIRIPLLQNRQKNYRNMEQLKLLKLI